MAGSVISEPKVTLNIIENSGFIGLTDQRVLFVGQKTSGGSAVSGALEESIQRDADIEARFGERSLLTQMLRAARKINEETRFDAIALDDNGSAVSAEATITLAGTATADGTLTFEIVSAENQTFTIDVLTSDTAATVATALSTAISADDKAPFTSGVALGVVTLTAANGGTAMNDQLLRVTGSVAGLTVTLSGWSSGATDPSITSLFDVVEDERYQTVVYPGVYDQDELFDFINPRWNATNDVLDGQAIVTQIDTLANLKTNGEAFNSQSVTMFGDNIVAIADEFLGSHSRELPDVVSSYFGGARALRLTDGANLADVVVTTNGLLDYRGGPALAALPYFNTPFPDLPVAPVGTFWTKQERGELAKSGVSVIGPNRSRQGTVAGTVYTTETTDGAGNPDDTFKFLNTVDSSSVGREFQFENLKGRYAQSRLTAGDLRPGRSMENESSIRAYILTLYTFLSETLVVYQTGADARRFFTDNLTVNADVESGLVTVTERPPLVGQLREISGTIQVNFQTEG